MGLLIGVLTILAMTASILLVILAVRRALLVGAQRRRGRAAQRLREVAAALVVDGEPPQGLSQKDNELLAEVLWDFSRQVTGSGRDEIGRYFDSVGFVERQLSTLTDRRVWRRAWSAFILGDVCSDRAVPGLVDRLNDPTPAVRTSAVRSLGRLRATSSAPSIAAAIAERRVPFALAGAMLLEIGPGAAPAMATLLTHPDPAARAAGVRLLGNADAVQYVEDIEVMLSDVDPTVRAQCCLALGRLGAQESAMRLRATLDDDDPRVRAGAASALGDLGDDAALVFLLIQAKHDCYEPAHAAAAAAVQIDADQAMIAARQPDAGAHLAEAVDRYLAAR